MNEAINLTGEWHIKLYRTYTKMFQNFDEEGSVANLKWEDPESALLPTKDQFSLWARKIMPNDNYATGGLLPLSMFPKWSELWACRTFTVPENFKTDNNVLLLGIVDDCDVVYINGICVASSGFVNGEGEKVLDPGHLGGFDYQNDNLDRKVRFERSYWEDEREYRIPAGVIRPGSENTIAIRIYNNNGNGGFYQGHPYFLCEDPSVADTVKKPYMDYGDPERCFSDSYESKLLGRKATYSIYLPPDYFLRPEKRYPVVYLLHGINSSSFSFLRVDKIGRFMDREINNGNILGMIVVMPDAGKQSFYRDTEGETSDAAGPWKSFITEDIRRIIDEKYRTLPDAGFRGISGISMGAYGAVTIGCSRPDLYSSVGLHMGYLPKEEILPLLEDMDDADMRKYDFYLDCGLQDSMVDYKNTVAIHEYLLKIGKTHGYSLRDGEHNSAFYMAGMAASMKMHSEHFKRNTK